MQWQGHNQGTRTVSETAARIFPWTDWTLGRSQGQADWLTDPIPRSERQGFWTGRLVSIACQPSADRAHCDMNPADPAGERGSEIVWQRKQAAADAGGRASSAKKRASAHGSRSVTSPDGWWLSASRAFAGACRSPYGRHVANTRICDLFPCLPTERNAILALNRKGRQCISWWERMPYCDRSIYNLTNPHPSSSIHNKELVRVVSAKADV